MGKLRSNCWAFFEKTLNEWLRYYFGTNCERNLGVSFKMCLMGILMGSFRIYSQFAHWSSCDQCGGLFLKKFKTCPLGMWWVNCLKDHKKITICPLGFTPFAPSDTSRGTMKLPLDLINEIVSHIPPDDKQPFWNCSLAAKSWIHPSQRCLFKAIWIYPQNLRLWPNNVSPRCQGHCPILTILESQRQVIEV